MGEIQSCGLAGIWETCQDNQVEADGWAAEHPSGSTGLEWVQESPDIGGFQFESI